MVFFFLLLSSKLANILVDCNSHLKIYSQRIYMLHVHAHFFMSNVKDNRLKFLCNHVCNSNYVKAILLPHRTYPAQSLHYPFTPPQRQPLHEVVEWIWLLCGRLMDAAAKGFLWNANMVGLKHHWSPFLTSLLQHQLWWLPLQCLMQQRCLSSWHPRTRTSRFALEQLICHHASWHLIIKKTVGSKCEGIFTNTISDE